MKCSDYIVRFLISKNITHTFGYPGGMVTHLMDSFRKYDSEIHSHVCYHEQAGAFEACGYAQASGRAGMAYATSGPGAVNMITGICNAWFDSIPVIFITGQVNRNESSAGLSVRQKGFQETDIVSMVKPITKYAVYVDDPARLPEYLNTAYSLAMNGRKGPVLLDVPMDVMRSDTQEFSEDDASSGDTHSSKDFRDIAEILIASRKPCVLFGAGVKDDEGRKLARELSAMLKLPCLTSMIAVDVLPSGNPYNFGFIGAYGSRTANFIAAKCDLLLSLGSRLDIRQTGTLREEFAGGAKIIRIDVDAGELSYELHRDDINIKADARDVMKYLLGSGINHDWHRWLEVCTEIRNELSGIDNLNENIFIERLSKYIPDNTIITADVGQNQIWSAQSFRIKPSQKMLFSGGLGAMGYSLPASIGAYYASGRPVVSLNGDGGLQMNIQELQFIARENLPVKVILFNNYALGMLRHFQEMYFGRRYIQTTRDSGYTVPDFGKIAAAYGLDYYFYDDSEQIGEEFMKDDKPALIEIALNHETVIIPKSRFGSPAQDQEPLIDRRLYEHIMSMEVLRKTHKGGGGSDFLVLSDTSLSSEAA